MVKTFKEASKIISDFVKTEEKYRSETSHDLVEAWSMIESMLEMSGYIKDTDQIITNIALDPDTELWQSVGESADKPNNF